MWTNGHTIAKLFTAKSAQNFCYAETDIDCFMAITSIIIKLERSLHWCKSHMHLNLWHRKHVEYCNQFITHRLS